MRQQVKRAGSGAYLAGGDPQVAGGGCQAAVAEQELNRADVGSRFQQMDGKRAEFRTMPSKLSGSLISASFSRQDSA